MESNGNCLPYVSSRPDCRGRRVAETFSTEGFHVLLEGLEILIEPWFHNETLYLQKALTLLTFVRKIHSGYQMHHLDLVV